MGPYRKSRLTAFTCGIALSLTIPFTPVRAKTAATITEEVARAIGVDAYLYFYPLLSMDITRLKSTNIAPGKRIGIQTLKMLPNRLGRVLMIGC